MTKVSRNLGTICECGAVAVVRTVQKTVDAGVETETQANMCQTCAKAIGVDVSTMFRDGKNAQD